MRLYKKTRIEVYTAFCHLRNSQESKRKIYNNTTFNLLLYLEVEFLIKRQTYL